MSDINSLDRRRMALYGWMLLAPALILLATFAVAVLGYNHLRARLDSAHPNLPEEFYNYAEQYLLRQERRQPHLGLALGTRPYPRAR